MISLNNRVETQKYLGVSKNRGTPKMDGENNGNPLLKWMIWGVLTHWVWKHPYGPGPGSIFGFSIINHPFWGIPIFGNPHLEPHFLRSFHEVSWYLPGILSHTWPWRTRGTRIRGLTELGVPPFLGGSRFAPPQTGRWGKGRPTGYPPGN